MRRLTITASALFVIAAIATLMLCHWDVRHDGVSREVVFGEGLTGREVESLARNQAAAAIGALAFGALVGFLYARRNRAVFAEALRRTAWRFAPGFIAAFGILTNIYGYEQNVARAFEALAASAIVAALWASFDLWPIRATDAEPHAPGRYAGILALAVLIYAILFSWLCIARYNTYFAALKDLGMYTQQLWGNLHGHWFLVSGFKLPRDTMLAEHFMPLVALLTPFYAFWPDPRTILVLQAVAVALAAVPLYAIGVRFGLDRRAALFLAGSFLLHPQLQVGNMYDFHPDAFVPLFSLAAFWALLTLDERFPLRREGDLGSRAFPTDLFLLYIIVVLLWLSYKEDSMFGVAMLGFYALAFRRRPVIGAATVLLGVAWGALAIGWIIPHFRGESYAHVDRYYYLIAPYGYQPGEGSFFVAFLKAASAHPLDLASRLVTAPRLLALLTLFAPVLFLSFLGPKELLIALPALALNLLSREPVQHEFQLHYSFAVLPFVYVSAMSGLRFLTSHLPERAAEHNLPGCAMRRQLAVSATAFLVALALCRMFGETPLSRPFHPARIRATAHHRLAPEFLRAVPRTASLAAQTGLAAHATHRLEIYEFPYLERNPEYVLLDAQAPTWPLSTEEYPKVVKDFLAAGKYGVMRYQDGYILLRRGHSTENNAQAAKMIERFS